MKTPSSPPEKINVTFEGDSREIKNNEDVLPPTIKAVGGRLSQFVEGWKHITNDPYVLSIVTKGYRLRLRVHPFYENPRGRYGPHRAKTKFKA